MKRWLGVIACLFLVLISTACSMVESELEEGFVIVNETGKELIIVAVFNSLDNDDEYFWEDVDISHGEEFRVILPPGSNPVVNIAVKDEDWNQYNHSEINTNRFRRIVFEPDDMIDDNW